MSAKIGKSKDGHIMHYSVGAIIKREDKILMIDRAIFPPGFACLAGHIEAGENPEDALIREISEESGLKLISSQLLCEEEVDPNLCSRGVPIHYWYVYECVCEGNSVLFPTEEKSIDWYTVAEIKQLDLEPIWRRWLTELKYI